MIENLHILKIIIFGIENPQIKKSEKDLWKSLILVI